MGRGLWLKPLVLSSYQSARPHLFLSVFSLPDKQTTRAKQNKQKPRCLSLGCENYQQGKRGRGGGEEGIMGLTQKNQQRSFSGFWLWSPLTGAVPLSLPVSLVSFPDVYSSSVSHDDLGDPLDNCQPPLHFCRFSLSVALVKPQQAHT